jgi:uncharacterized protein
LQFSLFSLALVVVSGGAHWALARWVVRVVPRFAKQRRVVFGVAAGLVVVAPLLRLLTRYVHNALLAELFAIVMLEVMTVMIAIVPFTGVVLLSRLATARSRRAASWTQEPAGSTAATDTAPVTLGRREALERIGGLAALGATGAALGWGMVRGRHAFVLEELAVRIPGLPRGLDGYTIAQVSDLHAGTFVGERELREGAALVNAAKADLVVATGDLVDLDPRFAPVVARALAGLRARDGVVAVLGNHDYYAGYGDVLEALAGAGVTSLVNAGRVVRAADGGGFALLGIDDLWAQRSGGAGPDLERAIRMVPPHLPRVLLAHQPTFIYEAAQRVALQLSGHTHGGQINPGFSPAKVLMPFVAGAYDVDGTTLYVNRGFGTAGPPVRIGAPPEVTKIVLVAG